MNDILRRRRALMASSGGNAHGTWEDLFRAIDAGTYATEYSTGEKIPLDLGAQGTINMEIVKFNADTDENGHTVPVSMIGVELLTTSKRYNPALSNDTEGTGNIGGWEKSELRSYLQNTVYPLIPSAVRARIKSVKKYTQGHTDASTNDKNMVTYDSVWSPSFREIIGQANNTQRESSGVVYYPYIDNNTSTPAGSVNAQTWRTKKKWNGSSAIQWWIRTCDSGTATQALAPNNLGSFTGGYVKYVQNSYGVCVGFCIG